MCVKILEDTEEVLYFHCYLVISFKKHIDYTLIGQVYISAAVTEQDGKKDKHTWANGNYLLSREKESQPLPEMEVHRAEKKQLASFAGGCGAKKTLSLQCN